MEIIQVSCYCSLKAKSYLHLSNSLQQHVWFLEI